MDNCIEVKECRSCGFRLPEPFINLGLQPLANSYRDPKDMSIELAYPLAVCFCINCCLVQLTHNITPSSMFSDYAYFSSYSESFLKHAEQMADDITHDFNLTNTSKVLEIGSNDGYLLQFFKNKGISVLGVDPASNIAAVANDKGIKTINKFFGSEVVAEITSDFGQADVIIGNNVLAHVSDIKDFVKSVYRCLKIEGVAIFEFPYLGNLIENTEFDTIYHEHTFYYSVTALRHLFNEAGLSIFDITTQDLHGGTIRIYVQRNSNQYRLSYDYRDLIAEEESKGLTNIEYFRSFGNKVKRLRYNLLDLLNTLKLNGRKLAAYGAPAKGNTLLNYCGVDTNLIQFTVDISPHKQGKLLPGSRIPILDRVQLINQNIDYAVLLPWNWSDEIIKQQEEYMTKGGRFIIPIPAPTII